MYVSQSVFHGIASVTHWNNDYGERKYMEGYMPFSIYFYLKLMQTKRFIIARKKFMNKSCIKHSSILP